MTVVKVVAVAVAVIAVSSTSVAAFAVWDTFSSVKPGIHLAHLSGQTAQAIPDVGSIEGGVNLLLAGTDTRTGQAGFQNRADLAGSSGAGNNDVTMLLHISQDHTNATVVSIPRDLMVPIPACPRSNGGTTPATSRAMFNTTLSRGGLSCVVLTAEKLTGLSIPYAAEISFDGVIGMSNAVGGVTVCLATPVKDRYVGLNLAAGEVTLVGANALAFVRSRHGVGDGSDLGRISNQQLFLSALMRKMTSAGVLSNPITLYSIANTALKNMQFSDTLTNPTTMVEIALALKGISLSNVVFLQYPSISDPAESGRVIPETAAAAVLDRALVADQPVKLTGKVGRAAVLDTAAPAATPAPTASASIRTPAPTATATSGPTAVALPSDVTGQTASQQTCTKGN
ncbi:MAG: LCP family protein [Lacisediminihabitans sp.]